MKIIIVGAGEVGYNIANRLALENQDVTIIDQNPIASKRLSEALDVHVITASGSNPKVLIDAGIKDAEILLAVTDSDDTNLSACLMTDLISPTTKKILRIRNSDFQQYKNRLTKETPHIDTIINPETEVVNAIRKLMNVPDAMDVGDFIEGKVKYICIRLDKDSPLAGMALNDFHTEFKEEKPLIAAIIRNSEIIVPRGDNVLETNDLIYFVSETQKLESTLAIFGKSFKPVQEALIIGGGRIGAMLAQKLEKDNIKTKIVELNIDRCNTLSEQMGKTIVLHGDGSDPNLFNEEKVSNDGAIIAVTDDDETNILISLLAGNSNIKNTIIRINKAHYFPLLSAIGIGKIVSPRLSAVSTILQNVRKGKVLSDISIFDERGEFIEAIALETSDITKKPLKKLSFPKGAILVCIFRDEHTIIPDGNDIVNPGDRIIMFALKHSVKKLEKLLTVKLDFF